jgi:hypothetical protein
MSALRARVQRNWVGISILFLAYAQGVFKESLWSDDYATLVNREAMADLQMSDGRLLGALIIPQSFRLIGEPSNIWILRSLGLLGLIILYFQTIRQIKNDKSQEIALISVAIAFCTPGFQMYVHWATTWPYLWASIAGVFGFHCWKHDSKQKKFIGVFLLVIAIMTYPPAALFYFALSLVSQIINEVPTKLIVKDLISGIKLLFTSGVTAAFITLITLDALNIQRTERVRFINNSEILEKLFWFLTRPIVTGLRPFFIDSPEAYWAGLSILPAAVIILLGIKTQARNLNESFLNRFVIFSISVCMPLIPILISPENQIEFRFILFYSWTIAVLSIYFLIVKLKQMIIIKGWKDDCIRAFTWILLSLFALAAAVNVNLRYDELFGNSYKKKNTFLNKSIQSCVEQDTIRSVSLMAPAGDFPRKNNLGVYSLQTDLYGPWVSIPNLRLVLNGKNLDVPITYYEERTSLSGMSDSRFKDCLIDLEEFRKEFKNK